MITHKEAKELLYDLWAEVINLNENKRQTDGYTRDYETIKKYISKQEQRDKKIKELEEALNESHRLYCEALDEALFYFKMLPEKVSKKKRQATEIIFKAQKALENK